MLSSNNIQVVTPEQYPCLTKQMYALGNVDLLEKKSVAVAGTRKIDSNSAQWLRHLISQLRADCTVASGLALGTDAIAHKSALENGLGTIAVLPSGISNITPKTNIPLAKAIIASNGLLLSEYEPKQGIRSNRQYIERNQIIVDISKMLIVPQFETRSGTRHTVDFAQKANQYIVVQNQNYSGNQFIINSGSYHTITK